MHKSSCVLLVLASVILLNDQGRVLGHIQHARYNFPRLYTFDDYDRCFQINDTEPQSSTYCMVYAEINPDNSSELWQQIMNHWETNTFNYRYDRLFFGLCLDRCKNYAKAARLQGKNSLMTEDIISNEFTEYYEQVHKRPLDLLMRVKYSQIVQQCLNDEFQQKYNLNLRIFIKYCEGSNEKEQQIALAEKDPAEILLHKMFEIIVVLIVLSTLYDYCLKTKQTEENQTNEFYKTNLEQAGSRMLTSFSICRNYYRLVQPYRGESGKDFAFLDGYRTVTTLCVIFGHIFYTSFLHIQNPEYFESYVNSTFGSMILNSSIAIEIFMVMSGLFFYIKFTQAHYITPQTSVRKCVKIFFLLLSSRFLRYLPSVALLVLVNATVMSRFIDGPFWRHISDQNRVFSRENWWKNILMINNFSQKETMGPHTWYLAADLQLFAFYTIVLIVMAKYPQYQSRIMKYLAVMAIVIPTCVSYILKLGSAFVIKAESYRHGYFTNSEYYYQYTPFYNNLGGYLFGIWCGDLYLNHLRKQEVQKRFRGVLKYEMGAYLAFPIAFAIFWIGTVMMFKEPSIWTAIYSGLNRNIWIICVCGFPLLGMACKGGMVTYEFCCLPMFRVLGRMSFQMFVWHLLILQVLNGYIRQPFHMNWLYFASLTLLTFVISGIVAFFTALIVEYPFAQLLETLQPKRRDSVKEPTKEIKTQ